jgi:hypothetical protein
MRMIKRVQFVAIVVACVAITGWATAQTLTTIINGKLDVRSTASDALISRGWVEIIDSSTTPGPNMTLDSSHTAATGNMGSLLFQLSDTLVASVSSIEHSANTYGLNFGCYNIASTHRVCATLTGDGAFTLARQPSFLAYNSADDTLLSSGSTVDFDTEVHDNFGVFGSDLWFPPVTGTYLLCATVAANPTSNVATMARIVTSNRSYVIGNETPTAGVTAGLSGCVQADMEVADEAHVEVTWNSGTGTVFGSSSPYITFFSGRLMP